MVENNQQTKGREKRKEKMILVTLKERDELSGGRKGASQRETRSVGEGMKNNKVEKKRSEQILNSF